MKIEIKRQDFLKAWLIAEKIAVSKAIIEIVNSVRINASYDGTVILESTDLKTSVKCKAEGTKVIEPGAAILPVETFGGILKKHKRDTLMLEVNDTHGMLITERSRLKFTVVSPEDFPKIPQSEGAETRCEVTSSNLAAAITEGSSASSQPQDFPKYLGACLLSISDDTLKIVSTDGKRLAVHKTSCENTGRKEDILLPSKALKELARYLSGSDKTVKILADGPLVWFDTDDLEFSIRRIDAAFPDYERILNSNVETALQISCEELFPLLERVCVIAETTIPCIIVFDIKSEGNMRIYSCSGEGVMGEFFNANITGNPMQIGFNGLFFLEGLKAIGSGEIVIEFSGKEDQTRIMRKDNNNFLYMLMPSRLSPQDLIDNDNEAAEFLDFTEEANEISEREMSAGEEKEEKAEENF